VKRALLSVALLLLAYGLLREVAWRNDFMAAIGQARPVAILEVCFFAVRLVLLVAAPSYLAAWGAVAVWDRLTKS
jgi:hypothetical protein